MRMIALAIVFNLGFAGTWAQQSTLLLDRSKAILPEVIEWRRHFHRNPELSNREEKTAAYIADFLRGLGLEVKTGIAKTGVVGLLKGGKPGPCIALRADMDALPVEERNELPFRSTVKAEYLGQNVPVMHACGHDTHMAILMGTAKILSGMKKDIAGTVKFIFQPAEEGAPPNEKGGASLMVEEGVMDNPKVDAILGLHINSALEIGQVRYKPGPFMASSDWFTIRIRGVQTHGAYPWAGIDPIVVGTQIVNGLQTIVSRQENIVKGPVVITVGKFHAGVRNNIIPEEALLEGTIRTLDAQMQKEVHERIQRMAMHIAEASGAKVEVDIIRRTLVTSNDSSLVARALPSLIKAAGKANVSISQWTTGAEDFSYYGMKAPAFFFSLGGMSKGADPEKAAAHHTPDFYIDDSMLDVGVRAFCQVVLDYKN